MSFSQDQLVTYENGDLIFSEGDTGREMYIVQSGAVEIRKTCGNGKVLLARLEKGEFFGEMSLLESLPRSASAHALGTTRLLVIKPGGFLLKIRRDPTLAFEMLQSLSGRIRRANSAITEKENPAFSQLLKILENKAA